MSDRRPESGAMRPLIENAWRRRHAIVGAGASVFAAAIALGACLSPRYVSRSTLVMLIGPEYTVRLQPGAGTPPGTAFDPDHILGTETAILGGDDLARDTVRAIGARALYPALYQPPNPATRLARAVLGVPQTLLGLAGVARAPEPTPDPVELAVAAFEHRLAIEPSKTANVIALGFTHRDPALARRTLQAFERLYLDRRRALYRQAKSGAMRVELDRVAARLDRAEHALADFRRTRALPDYATQMDTLLHEQADLAHQRDAAAHSIAAGLARIASLRAALVHEPADLPSGVDINYDGRVASLRDDLEQLHAREVDTLARYRPDSDNARALDEEIRTRSAQLASLEGAPGVSAAHRSRNPARDAIATDLLAALAGLDADRAGLDADTRAGDAIAVRIATLDDNQRRLAQLSVERDAALDASRGLAAALATEDSVEAVEARALPSVRIADAPSLPIRPRPIPLLLAIAGALGGIGTAGALALLSHAFRRTLLSGDELEASGLGVLASIPRGDPMLAMPPLGDPNATA